MIILMYFCERNLTSSSRVAFTVSEICIQRTRLAFVVVDPPHFRLVFPTEAAVLAFLNNSHGRPSFRQGVSIVEAYKVVELFLE